MASAAAVESAAASAGRTVCHRSGFINNNVSAAHVSAVESRYGRLRFLIRRHFHESKTFAAARELIHDYRSGNHGTVLAEKVFEFVVSSAVREAANVKFGAHKTWS